MTIETLITTMHQKDDNKFFEMNIETNAIIANQAEDYYYCKKEHNGNCVKFITTATKGVSINRNIAISYAEADIVLFADDDMVFLDGYKKAVLDEFERHPEADAIKFYSNSTNELRPLAYKQPDKFVKASKRTLMPCGVIGLAVKREVLLKTNSFFHTNIGPGTDILSGEDSVFFSELLEKKVGVYLSPKHISIVKQEDSSWFTGYTDKYFISIGYIYSCIYKKLAILATLRRSWKMRKSGCEQGFFKRISLMKKGIKKHKKGHH